ncbi:hypothetical protein JXC34_00850 [Candidatus Woesearchaeota archaeon]|nr:hypothetical protein [Candidatus Woesearchaeota archaeon]
MGESLNQLPVETQIEEWFKKIAAWGAFELAEDTRIGKISTHFWGELYLERTPDLETFLQTYRG